MNITLKNRPENLGNSGASLIEVLVVVALVGTLFVSLYAGIASGFGVVNVARENLRANQIILERLETIRLYNWDQINEPGFIATNFTAYFFPQLPMKDAVPLSRPTTDDGSEES